MSSPQTSPTRYGVTPEEKIIPRLGNPENLNYRLAATGPKTVGDMVSLKMETQKDPHDVSLVSDPDPQISAIDITKKGDEIDKRTRGSGDAVVIDASQEPTFTPDE